MAMGRPKEVENKISELELFRVLRMYPTLEECAGFFDISVKSLTRYIRQHYKLTFDQLRQKKFAATRLKIRKAQIDLALKRDRTMLIWLGKVLLEQVETTKVVQESKVSVDTKNLDGKTMEELAEIYKKVVGS